MQLEPKTELAQETLRVAEQEARRLVHKQVTTGHLLIALFKRGWIAGEALLECGLTLDRLEGAAHAVLDGVLAADPAQVKHWSMIPYASDLLDASRKIAWEKAQQSGYDEIHPEHLLSALLDQEDTYARQMLDHLAIPDVQVTICLAGRLRHWQEYQRVWVERHRPTMSLSTDVSPETLMLLERLMIAHNTNTYEEALKNALRFARMPAR